jgi:hypothetical protein
VSNDAGPAGRAPTGAATDCTAGDPGEATVALGLCEWDLVVHMLDQRARYSALSGLGAAYSSVADRISAQLPEPGWRPRLSAEGGTQEREGGPAS